MNEKSLEASIIIVSYNTRELLKECLEKTLAESQEIPCEIIVIDNASKDGSPDLVAQKFPTVQLIKSEVNLGFAAANNVGFRLAKGRYIVLLNSDAFLQKDSLKLSLEKMNEHPSVGLAGGRLVGRNGSWQPSARMFPSLTNDFLHLSGLAAKYPQSSFFGRADNTWSPPQQSLETDWVPGAFAIIRKEALEKSGYFDERFFLYYEEVDLCKKIKNEGYKIWYWPEIRVIHLGGESSKTIKEIKLSTTGSQLTLWRMRSCLLYYRKHHGFLGAFSAMSLEIGWHFIRGWKNKIFSTSEGQAKAEESFTMIRLMQQAWSETEGGKVSPPRPW